MTQLFVTGRTVIEFSCKLPLPMKCQTIAKYPGNFYVQTFSNLIVLHFTCSYPINFLEQKTKFKLRNGCCKNEKIYT